MVTLVVPPPPPPPPPASDDRACQQGERYEACIGISATAIGRHPACQRQEQNQGEGQQNDRSDRCLRLSRWRRIERRNCGVQSHNAIAGAWSRAVYPSRVACASDCGGSCGARSSANAGRPISECHGARWTQPVALRSDGGLNGNAHTRGSACDADRCLALGDCDLHGVTGRARRVICISGICGNDFVNARRCAADSGGELNRLVFSNAEVVQFGDVGGIRRSGVGEIVQRCAIVRQRYSASRAWIRLCSRRIVEPTSFSVGSVRSRQSAGRTAIRKECSVRLWWGS